MTQLRIFRIFQSIHFHKIQHTVSPYITRTWFLYGFNLCTAIRRKLKWICNWSTFKQFPALLSPKFKIELNFINLNSNVDLAQLSTLNLLNIEIPYLFLYFQTYFIWPPWTTASRLLNESLKFVCCWQLLKITDKLINWLDCASEAIVCIYVQIMLIRWLKGLQFRRTACRFRVYNNLW